MRKWPALMLLVLLPLSLWAGALMPAPSPSPQHIASLANTTSAEDSPHAHHVHDTAHSQPTNSKHVPLVHHASHDSDLSPAQHDDFSKAAGICAEGPGCMACSVCHMTAGLPEGQARFANSAVQTTPAATVASWFGHAWPPLIKPPIA